MELGHQQFESFPKLICSESYSLLRLGGMPHKKVCLLSSRNLKVHKILKKSIFLQRMFGYVQNACLPFENMCSVM